MSRQKMPSKDQCLRTLGAVYTEMDKSDTKAQSKPSQEWEIDHNHTNLKIQRYGFCFWTKILFLKNGLEVYRLERGPMGETRHEYVFGQEVRQYDGDQPCFVEYFDYCIKNKDAIFNPTALAVELKLGPSHAQAYLSFLQKLLV